MCALIWTFLQSINQESWPLGCKLLDRNISVIVTQQVYSLCLLYQTLRMCRLRGGSKKGRSRHGYDTDHEDDEDSSAGEGTSLRRRLRSSCWLSTCGDFTSILKSSSSPSSHHNHSPQEVSLHIMEDEPSALSFKDEATRYLFQEDWLSTVCGVPKRR